MAAKFYADMTDEELAQVDLVKFTKLNIGDRVTHKNAGEHGGSGTRITKSVGTIVGHQNQGLTHFGSLFVTVTVNWDDGTDNMMHYSLAVKAA